MLLHAPDGSVGLMISNQRSGKRGVLVAVATDGRPVLSLIDEGPERTSMDLSTGAEGPILAVISGKAQGTVAVLRNAQVMSLTDSSGKRIWRAH